MLAGRNLGDEAGRDGRGGHVMTAVVLAAHQEQFLHVDGVGVAHGRRELSSAGVALLHDNVLPPTQEGHEAMLVKKAGCSCGAGYPRPACPAVKSNGHDSVPVDCVVWKWIETQHRRWREDHRKNLNPGFWHLILTGLAMDCVPCAEGIESTGTCLERWKQETIRRLS